MLPTINLEEHIKYLHQCAFSPTPRTWIQAVKKGHFKTWPGVTVEAIKRYLPKSEATTMVHLDQQRKNTQSTKLQKDDHDTMTSPSPLEKRTQHTCHECSNHLQQRTRWKTLYRSNWAISCSKQQSPQIYTRRLQFRLQFYTCKTTQKST